MQTSASAAVSADTAARFICLTPAKNEAWIIRHFAAAARTWATNTIVADQLSSDGTLEILHATPGVKAVINDSEGFNEHVRQNLLLSHARELPGKRILFGLDADEALSANCTQTDGWKKITAAAPGTVIRLRWANVLPGFKEAWIPPEPTVFGFVDDNCIHVGQRIHGPRVPSPASAPVLDIDDIVVLHFQYVAWERMESKHRWYQAWEYAKVREKRPLEIFRQYNHRRAWSRDEIHPLRPEWLDGYLRAGIDFRSVRCEPVTWWDREIVQMLREHGPKHFRRVAIWDKDWNTVAAQVGVQGIDLSDPRTPFEKIAHRLLPRTQNNRGNWGVRGFEHLLRVTGW
jgi:hypothetical protein